MSEEEAKAFLKKAGENKLWRIIHNSKLPEKLKGVDSEEKLFAIVKAEGFDFTKEELISVLPKMAKEAAARIPGMVAGSEKECMVTGCLSNSCEDMTHNKMRWIGFLQRIGVDFGWKWPKYV